MKYAKSKPVDVIIDRGEIVDIQTHECVDFAVAKLVIALWGGNGLRGILHTHIVAAIWKLPNPTQTGQPYKWNYQKRKVVTKGNTHSMDMEREEEIIQHRSMTTTYHAEATNLMKTLDFELIEISGWLLLSQKTCLALSAIVGLRQLFLFFFFFFSVEFHPFSFLNFIPCLLLCTRPVVGLNFSLLYK